MVYTRVGVWIPQCPQRTGRLGRGLEMVDGHQEHSTRLGSPHSIELALDSIELCLELAIFFLKPAPAGVGSSRGVMISSVGVIPRYGLHLCPFTVNSFPS
ncbi:unnamed protein product [Microthlaspi erraticum]|uniref:Uncharacterized protein n=1 Tax=Microthlaspi erraticum TaxID=1685480 RepID=A0A6D2JV55_9BRAS|nr:unnamed protein product [Microthlaspi erraticum]